MNPAWKHPFNCIISAPTKSGKTEFVKKLVLFIDQMIEPTPIQIFWCFSEWQKAYSELSKIKKNIEFITGFPDIETLKKNIKTPKLLILDDMMHDMKGDTNLTQLFTKGSHHWNLSIIHIVQNAFYEGLRTSRINAQYIVLMKNPGDRLQIQTLGRQIFPGSKHFIEAYDDATAKAYGYIVIDLNQTTPENMRLRTNIFPTDEKQIVYVSRD
jgi:hypothetical protein